MTQNKKANKSEVGENKDKETASTKNKTSKVETKLNTQASMGQQKETSDIKVNNKKMPGSLEVELSLELITKQTVKLFFGGENNNNDNDYKKIFGIKDFAYHCRAIYFQTYTQKNILAKLLYHYLGEYVSKIENKIRDVEANSSIDVEGLKIRGIYNKKPKIIECKFNLVLPYRLSTLLIKWDRVLSKIIIAKRLGLISNREYGMLAGGTMKMFRHINALPSRYKHAFITKDDYINKSNKYNEALLKNRNILQEIGKNMKEEDIKKLLKDE